MLLLPIKTKREFNLAFLFVICSAICIIISCNKIENSSYTTNSKYGINAKEVFSTFVNNESSLLNLPYTQLKRTSNLRRFARLGKLSKAALWDKEQKFNKDGIEFSIVPIKNDLSHKYNPEFETLRFLLFSKSKSEKTDFNIVELYSPKNQPLSSDIENSLLLIANNILTKNNYQISEINASVIVYNEFYDNINSYSIKNGYWTKSKIIVENTSKRPVYNSINSFSTNNVNKNNNLSSLLSSVSPMSGCQSCTTYYLVGIWYDLSTGAIVDTEILDTWDECVDINYTPQGNAPGSTVVSNQNTSTTKTINKNVSDPCLSALISSMSGKISDLVEHALNNENISKPMNFNYTGVSGLVNGTNGQLVSMYEDANGVLNFDIHLNENTLPNASQEYMLRTLLHEALHGVLLSNGVAWNNLTQHNSIANAYRELISDMLIEAFPNLSAEDAYALSWEGLGTTTLWDSLSINEKTDIAEKLAEHRNHNNSGAGTGC